MALDALRLLDRGGNEQDTISRRAIRATKLANSVELHATGALHYDFIVRDFNRRLGVGEMENPSEPNCIGIEVTQVHYFPSFLINHYQRASIRSLHAQRVVSIHQKFVFHDSSNDFLIPTSNIQRKAQVVVLGPFYEEDVFWSKAAILPYEWAVRVA